MANRSTRADGAATREQLLDAAVRIVAEQGLAALSHRAVAAEAGLPAASAGYHLASTRELRQATLERSGRRIGNALRDRLHEAADRPDDVPLICAGFALEVVTERRADAIVTFELITSAMHDESLLPGVRFLDDSLAQLLLRYAGSSQTAYALGAAIQGRILVALSTRTDKNLHEDVRALVARHRYTPTH